MTTLAPDAVAQLIRSTPDPLSWSSDKKKLGCKQVHTVFEENADGLVEALYLDSKGQPHTAFIRDGEVAYVEEGW